MATAGTGPGPVRGAAQDGNASAGELWATRVVSRMPSLLRRVPFTASVVVLTVLIGLVARTIWSPVDQKPWFPEVAYGLPALAEGRWWTHVSLEFRLVRLAEQPFAVIAATGSVLPRRPRARAGGSLTKG